ncbi:MAG: type III-B CRISPR module RAMP protein Cmr6, partial [Cyclobacteriaceae bacterium]
MNTPNLGWLFYKDYYAGYDWASADSQKTHFEGKNKRITDQTYTASLHRHEELGQHSFRLKTTYPGLLIGTGYQHETGTEGEVKSGFHFDYSSGLPQLPGSSLKGLLRSFFPGKEKEQNPKTPEERLTREDRKDAYEGKIEFMGELVGEIAGVTSLDKARLQALEQEMFEGKDTDGKPLPIYQRDTFYEAVLSERNHQHTTLVGEDFITPHEPIGRLKNPIPLLFLKVMPEVEWLFRFTFRDSQAIPGLTAAHKQELMRQILLTFGAGAKTNVGYGQFSEEAPGQHPNHLSKGSVPEVAEESVVKRPVKEKKPVRDQYLPKKVHDQLKNGTVFIGEIDTIEGKDVYVNFTVPDEKGIPVECMVSKTFDKLKVGSGKSKRLIKDLSEISEGMKVTVTVTVKDK